MFGHNMKIHEDSKLGQSILMWKVATKKRLKPGQASSWDPPVDRASRGQRHILAVSALKTYFVLLLSVRRNADLTIIQITQGYCR